MKNKIIDKIKIVRLNNNNFYKNSLDDFEFYQQVEKCWRMVDGNYKLVPVCYVEELNLQERRKMALKLIREFNLNSVVFMAMLCDSIVGFVLLNCELFGSTKQYIDLSEFYISKPYRRLGIGEKLFNFSCAEAKILGATKIYISAHSAEESIAAYKKYGCVFAKEADLTHVEKEPYDLQLEYDLSLRIYEINDKEKHLNLFLLADEQLEMVKKYLYNSTTYVIEDCGVKGEITIQDIGNGVLEIKNLAILPEFQRCGYGKKLIEFICAEYKNKYSILQVGTGDSPLTVPFYQKNGFEKSHIIKNFFIDNYDHPIIEDGVRLKDMIYLRKNLS